MTALLVTDARIATVDGVVDRGWLLADRGRIARIGAGDPDETAVSAVDDGAEVVEAGGAWLLPGFIDVHVHGALGHETMDGDVHGLERMAQFYARHGVTSFLATTWTGTTDDTLAALGGVARGVRELDSGARLLGAHMEGPYLNSMHCGAQDVGLIRPADRDEADRFFDTGVVRLITVAPEVDDNLGFVEECTRRGIAVSAGHTDATYDEMAEAVDRGVRHVTHTFNAMRPLHHREPGVVGAALTMPGLTAEIIADGVHVHPVVVNSVVAARGAEGVVLVTDAMRATGMPAGEYAVGDRWAVLSDGAVRLPDGALAGSVLTMDVGLRNLQRASGRSLAVLWPAASRNAARVAGVADRKGSIAVGMDADLVLVDDEVTVGLTIVEGRVAHRSGDGRSVSGLPATLSVRGP